MPTSPISFLARTEKAINALDAVLGAAKAHVRALVDQDGRVSAALVDREQRAAHGLAWFATYVEALREMAGYAERLVADGRFGVVEEAITRIAFGEYLSQLIGGIAMSQGEIVRPADLGLSRDDLAPLGIEAIETLIARGNTAENRAALVTAMTVSAGQATIGDPGLDETLDEFRVQMRRFADAAVAPNAHKWHLANAYIPIEIISHLASRFEKAAIFLMRCCWFFFTSQLCSLS